MCTDLLPTNIDPVINTLDRLGCERLSALEIAADELLDIGDPMRIDARYLDELASEMQTYFIAKIASESNRRKAIAASFDIHRKKGTPWALRRAFEAQSIDASIDEWFEYGGEPYHFRIAMKVGGDDRYGAGFFASINGAIEVFKNVRSVCDGVEISLADAKIPIAVSSAGTVGVNMELGADVSAVTEIPIVVSSGVALGVAMELTPDVSGVTEIPIIASSAGTVGVVMELTPDVSAAVVAPIASAGAITLSV